MDEKKLKQYQLILLHFISIGATGIFLPFWPLFLNSRITDPQVLGLILGMGFMIKLIFNPLLAQVIDRQGKYKRPLCIAFFSGAITYILFLANDNFYWIFILNLMIIITFCPIIPVITVLSLQAHEKYKIDYAHMRLWGSVGFIITTVFMGALLSMPSISVNIIPISLSFCMISGLLMALTLKEQRPETHPPQSRWEIGILLKSYPFTSLLLAIFFIQSSHGFYYGFSTIHWKSIGYSGNVISFFWAIGVISEIIIFLFSKYFNLDQYPERLIMAGALGGVIRWTILSFTNDPVIIAFSQTLHALTFGCTHLGTMFLISRMIPKNLSTTAQSLVTALVMGASIGMSIWASGFIYEQIQQYSYLLMTLFSFLGYLCVKAFSGKWKKIIS